MFDGLLGILSIAWGVVDGISVKKASHPQKSTNTSPAYPGRDAYLNNNERIAPVRMFKHSAKTKPSLNWQTFKSNYKVSTGKDAHDDNEGLESWVLKHSDILLKILNNPGRHLISCSDTRGVDVNELCDFLFRQEGIEAVERTSDGLIILSR